MRNHFLFTSLARFDKHCVYLVIDKDKLQENSSLPSSSTGPTTTESTVRSLIERHFLETILEEAQQERNSHEFKRMCLFCKKVFEENRAQLFDHLHHDHNLFLGRPDNIINASEFFDVLEGKLKLLQCLYCEKTFKSWNVLKEHMRKKGHKLLNPDNREYDKFYLINYLCSDKHWQQIKQENDFYIDNYNEDWCDWVEDDRSSCLCFFCPFSSKFDQIKEHLNVKHNFDFDRLILEKPDYYDRVRLVNYVRKKAQTNQCYICEEAFVERAQLLEHLTWSNHSYSDLKSECYSGPEFYFPTLDDDCLLFFLDDFKDVIGNEN